MTEPAVRRPVVVGIDGSSSAVQAVRWAAREAARRQVPLAIAHAYLPAPVHAPLPLGLPQSYAEAVADRGRQWLDAAAAEARDVAANLEVSTELTVGSAAGHLIERSATAGLVALGSRGLGGFTGLLIGSIAVAVATHGHSPVVVVRGDHPDAEPPDRPVVVGTDGSPTSEAAVAFAFDAAASRNAPLLAVRAWMDLPVGHAWEVGLAVNWDAIQAAEQQSLEQQLADYRSRYPQVPVEPVVVRDRPAHTLLEHTKNAQLVAVGSRGRGGFRGLLLGSTSQALIHHATCPVAVVPAPRR